jgi:hypothetical protein
MLRNQETVYIVLKYVTYRKMLYRNMKLLRVMCLLVILREQFLTILINFKVELYCVREN